MLGHMQECREMSGPLQSDSLGCRLDWPFPTAQQHSTVPGMYVCCCMCRCGWRLTCKVDALLCVHQVLPQLWQQVTEQ